MTIKATQATATALQADLRRWVWDAMRTRFTTEVCPRGIARASAWGHDFEVVSMTGILPGDPSAHDMGAALVRLVDCLASCISVERPGGVLILRGPHDPEDAQSVPLGVEAQCSPIGTHAYRVRLSLICHSITLEEARAHRREAVKAIL